MICERCGARNPPDAAWCTQCFTRFGASDAASPDGPGHGDQGGATVGPGAGASSSRGPDGGEPASGRDVRERDGVVEWRCQTCSGWNPLLMGTCDVCGSPRRGFGTGSDSSARVAGNAVVGASLVLPGLGHVLAGEVGSGLARVVLAVLWVGGGLSMVLSGVGTRGTLPGLVLLGGATALWAATTVDAHRLTTGRGGQLLATRRLAGLVVLVTGLLVAVALVTSPAATG